jgi:hypothetical protein
METIQVKIKGSKKTVTVASKFYEISQNNSGGSHVVDDKVCHRLFIEANSAEEATRIAEDLGCYWDGCSNGRDCSCCGDRWYQPDSPLDFDVMNTRWGGYEVSQWLTEGKKKGTISKDVAIQNMKAKYPGAEWLTEPIVENKYGSTRVVGKIKVDSVELYAQILADQFGWTTPEARIFYNNGEVREIYMNK